MTTGTSSHGAAAATVPPTKVDTAMPALATATAVTLVRVTPWNDAIPAGSAPSDAKAPSSACPLAAPAASGSTTPAATRSVRPVTMSFQPAARPGAPPATRT